MAKILIVDDDKDILRLMQFALQRAGHQVIVANGGPEGLQKVESEAPQLIIADVMMPEMTGYDFTRQVREMPGLEELPILIYSARFQPVDKQAALDAGATDYMPKTLSPPEIVKRIAHFLGDQQEESDASEKHNPVIGFFSLRGGSGVTSVAVNAAVALALGNKTPTSLTDLNPVAGHAGLFLKLRPQNNLANLLASPDPLSPKMLKPYLSGHSSQVYVLASPFLPPGKPAKHTPGEVVKTLSAAFKFNLLDMPHTLDETVVSVLPELNYLVLVISPDVPALQSAVAAKQFLGKNGLPAEKLKIILNHNNPGPGLAKEAIEKTLQQPLDAEIPFEADMLAAINSGQPLLLRNPRAEASGAIARFAVSLSK